MTALGLGTRRGPGVAPADYSTAYHSTPLHIQDPAPKDPFSQAQYGNWLQQNPFISQAMQHGLSKLEFLGQSLGKLGRPVKAGVSQLLGHQVDPSEYAAFLPFSDTLGLTDQKNAVSGEDIGRQLGWIDDSSSGAGKFFKSLALDAGLDPLSYLSFGAGSGARAGIGTAAQAAGSLARAARPASALESIAAKIPGLSNWTRDARVLRDATAGAEAGATPLVKLAGQPGTLTEAGQLLGREGLLPSTNAARMSGYKAMEQGGTQQLLDLAASGKLQGKEAQMLNEIIQGAQTGKAVPLQGLAEVNALPFGTRTLGKMLGLDARTVIGTDPLSRAVLQPLLGGWGAVPYAQDLWQNAVRYAPGIRNVRSLFSAETMGGKTRQQQELLSNLWTPGIKEARVGAGKDLAGIQQLLGEAGPGATPREVDKYLRQLGDLGWQIPMQTPSHAAPLVAQQQATVEKGQATIKAFLENEYKQGQRFGVPQAEFDKYLPRQFTGPGHGGFSDLKSKTAGGSPKASRQFPEFATDVLTDIFHDPAVSGMHPGRIADDKKAIQHIIDAYGARQGFPQPTPATVQTPMTGPMNLQQLALYYRTGKSPTVSTITPGAKYGPEVWNPVEEVMRMAKGLDPAYRQGATAYGNTVVRDLESYLPKQRGLVKEAELVNRSLALQAIPQDVAAATGVLPKSSDLTAALKELGYTEEAHPFLADTLSSLLNRTVRPDQLNEFRIMHPYLDAIKQGKNNLKDFGQSGIPGTLWTMLTNLFKTGNTVPHPAYDAANLMGGVAQNTISGIYDPNRIGPMKILGPYIDAAKALMGYPVKNLQGTQEFGRYGTEAAANQAMVREVMSYGFGGKTGQHAGDLITRSLGSSKEATPLLGEAGSLVGTEPLWQGMKGLLGIRGVAEPSAQGWRYGAEASQTTNPLLRGLESISEITDRWTKLAHYFGRIRQGLDSAGAAASTMAAHYDYRNLSKFEREWMRKLVPFYCVPDYSEILTRDGWKRYDDLIVGEEVMTYNVEKDELEWQPCQNKQAFEHDQELMTFETKRGRNFAFTPNHRWPVRVTGNTVKHPWGTYVYPEKRTITTGDKLTVMQSFIQAAEYKGKDSILTPDQARLVGWIVTDGYFRRRPRSPNYCEAVIYQSPGKYLDEVVQVAGGRPRPPHPQTGVICVPVEKVRKEEIVQYLDKDNLIKLVTRLSRESLEAMYDAMYKAEGTTPEKEGQTWGYFGQVPGGVKEAFQVIALLLGKRTKVGKTGMYVTENRFLKVSSGRRGMVHYKGRVWCPSTANGTWVMRQHGEIIITGNSWTRFNIPFYGDMLANNPGLISNLMRTEDAVDQSSGGASQYLPEFLRGQTAVPQGPAEARVNPESGRQELNQQYLTPYKLPFQEALNWMKTGKEGLGQLGEAIGARIPGPGYIPPDMPRPEFINREAMQTVGGQLNPLLKIAGEALTGKNFYSGNEAELASQARWWEDPDMKLLAGLARYSPFSRFVSDYQREKRNVDVGQLSPGQIAVNAILGPINRSVDLNAAQQKELAKLTEEQALRDPAARQRMETYVPLEEQNRLMTNDPQEQARLGVFRAASTQGQQQQLAGLQYKLEQLAIVKPRLEQLRQLAANRPLSPGEKYEMQEKAYAVQYEPLWRMQAQELAYKIQTETGIPGLSVPNPYGKPLQTLRMGIKKVRGNLP